MSSNSEDLFIKPGNQERGWNDPPQFSYGLQARGGQRKQVLTRRAPPTGSVTPPMAPPPSAPLTGSPVAPPPFSPVPPPPIGSFMTTPPTRCPITTQIDLMETEPDVEEVMSVLNTAVEAVRQNHKKSTVVSDIVKRLTLFESSWTRLSLVVRKRMKKLSSELESGLFDAADETHRSLMVDHVTEVSQWMVGIKRLIAEVRELSPDQLRVLIQDPNQDLKQAEDRTEASTDSLNLE